MIRFSDLRSKLVSLLGSVVSEDDTDNNMVVDSSNDVILTNDSKIKEPDGKIYSALSNFSWISTRIRIFPR